MEAKRQVQTNERSATSAPPAAQAVCSKQPTGCGKGLDSLDLANVAIVAGTAAVRAADGEDWTRAFKTGGPDEYQIYQEAKHRRKVEDDERAAAKVQIRRPDKPNEKRTVGTLNPQ